MRACAGVAVALALVACAGSPKWSRSGVSAEAAAADYADCRSMAQEATERDNAINADILASRGHDWEQSGTLDLHQSAFTAQSEARAGDVVAACMISKGYAPGG
jgi:hypothetical protein